MEQLTVAADVEPCGCLGDHRPTSWINHRHHVVPLAWGGPNTQDNLVTLCPTGHAVVHVLLDRWKRDGAVAGPGRMNSWLYAVALDGWTRWQGE